MRRVHGRKPPQPALEVLREPPGDGGAPVVTDERELARAIMIGESENVAGKTIEIVSGDAFGLAAEIVSALIGDDDAIARVCECTDLMAPAEPELRKPVKENYERAGLRPRFGHAQGHAA